MVCVHVQRRNINEPIRKIENWNKNNTKNLHLCSNKAFRRHSSMQINRQHCCESKSLWTNSFHKPWDGFGLHPKMEVLPLLPEHLWLRSISEDQIRCKCVASNHQYSRLLENTGVALRQNLLEVGMIFLFVPSSDKNLHYLCLRKNMQVFITNQSKSKIKKIEGKDRTDRLQAPTGFDRWNLGHSKFVVQTHEMAHLWNSAFVACTILPPSPSLHPCDSVSIFSKC